MIMGAGKTTVVGPLLAMLLAQANTLIIEVIISTIIIAYLSFIYFK